MSLDNLDDIDDPEQGAAPPPAFFTDVTDLVRRRLQVTEARLPDPVIQDEFFRTLALVQAQFPCVGPYADLTGTDQIFVDAAVAHMIAVLLYPAKFGGSNGPLNSVKSGTFEFRYGVDQEDERTGWTDQAVYFLEHVACITAQRQAAAMLFSPFTVAGLTRRRAQAPCGMGGGLSVLRDVLHLFDLSAQPLQWSDFAAYGNLEAR